MATAKSFQSRRQFNKIFLLTVPLLIVGCNHGALTANGWNAPKRLVQIDGYRDWTLVTKTAQDMSPSMAALCVGPDSVHLGDNPHLPKVFRVFVNPVGEKAMHSKVPSDFPEGTVIVKEKFDRDSFPGAKDPYQKIGDKSLSEVKNLKPILMTVMIKQAGKWSYFVTNGDGKIQKSNTQDCMKCHEKVKEQDFVFKPYVAPYPSMYPQPGAKAPATGK